MMERIVNFYTWVGLSVLILITTIALIEPLSTIIDGAVSNDSLDCTNTSIGMGDKMTCIMIKFFLFAFVMTALSLGWRYLREKQ